MNPFCFFLFEIVGDVGEAVFSQERSLVHGTFAPVTRHFPFLKLFLCRRDGRHVEEILAII
jgi:hypothetical protein